MTRLPTKSAGDQPTLDELRVQVRAAGLRGTTARLAVLGHLHAARSPLSHAEVADQLASRGFDRTTIYRNLVELAEANLLSRVEVGDHVWRFEVRRGAEETPGEHPHFLCLDCGEVSCLTDVDIKIVASRGRKQPELGEVTEVLLKGHCGRCG